MLGMKKNEAANAAPGEPAKQDRHIFCPLVTLVEDATASRVYAGEPSSSANLRYQSSLTDTARECSLQGDQIAIKVGAAGAVLLGPAGSAGSFSVPVRMAVVRKSDNEPIVTKVYHASVMLDSKQTQADFTIVSEPLLVPFTKEHAEDDYTIRVGIDGAGKTDEKSHQGAKL
jgi:hypothetical protein